MAMLNTRFYRESDDMLYSDGTIEDVMYERICKNDATMATDPEWAVFYHFSPIRQNILNWYPFKENCSILEIGAGCGALTGALAQRAAHVTACELTMNRARILYQRHKDCNNLEICVGNFLNATFDRQYDYIVINGVLEYARGIMGDQLEDPFSAFLNHAKSYLKPDGTILLAIENRFGLKYLAGAPEDHVGKIFSGVSGYQKGEHVRTFSKSELEALFDRTQLLVQRWYYPYPDYKFPTEIFTDDSVNSQKPVSLDIPFDMRRADLFDKEAVYETLMKERLAGNFSNSFLVELVSQKRIGECEPTYVKISNNRKKKFAVCTVLYEDNKVVEKIALYPEGEEHLAQMASRENSNTILQTVAYDTSNPGKLRYDLIEEESLRHVLTQQIQCGKIDAFWRTISTLYNSLYTNAPAMQPDDSLFASVFGPEKVNAPLHWSANINIDLNVDNVFCKDDHWQIIDNEWVFPFDIPAEYAMWRILSQLQQEKFFSAVLTSENIKQFLAIGENEISIFQRWEVYFAEQYVGIQDLSIHYQPVIPLDIDAAIDQLYQNNRLISHLFLFFEDREPEVLECAAENDNGKWIVTFASENIKNATWVRWDPLEGSACRVSNIHADGFQVKPINADQDEPEYTFATFDPQFSICGDFSQCSDLTVTYCCELQDWTTGFFKLEAAYNRARELQLQEAALKEQALNDLEQVTQQLHSQMESHQQYVLESTQHIDSLKDDSVHNLNTIVLLKQDNEQHSQTIATLNTSLQSAGDEIIRKEETIAALNNSVKQSSEKIQQLQTVLDEETEKRRVLLEYLSKHKLKAIFKILAGKSF